MVCIGSSGKGDTQPEKASYQPVVGVDLGILALANHQRWDQDCKTHTALKRTCAKIKRLQRVVIPGDKREC